MKIVPKAIKLMKNSEVLFDLFFDSCKAEKSYLLLSSTKTDAKSELSVYFAEQII